MRYRMTRPGDLPQLQSLWKQGFADSDADIDRFFEKAYPHCLGFAAEDAGVLCAALYALPQTLVARGREEKAAYLYAVTTAPAMRGRGICRALMAYAEKQLQKRWFSCALLVPGEASLFAFYESLGYRAQRTHTLQTLLPPAPHGELTPIDLRAYAGLRETILADTPHVRYDAQWLSYSGASFYALTLDGRAGCASVCPAPDGACVCELLPDRAMLPALSAVLPKTAVTVRAPAGNQAFAMLKWLDKDAPEPEPVYLAFAFE